VAKARFIERKIITFGSASNTAAPVPSSHSVSQMLITGLPVRRASVL
jgi:hypothetical protein